MVFPITLPNDISFPFQVEDNVGGVPKNREIDASLTGQSADFSHEGSLNTGYALFIFKFCLLA
jgi:hypothetical protein